MKRSREEQEILTRFGDRLRDLRKCRDLTQESLAAEAGFSRSYYTEIETGKRNISLLNVCRLARSLGVSASELLDVDAAGES